MNIYFAENRFYDAETGTWLSKDPARSGLNWYVYCESNPGTYVDVLGLTASFSTGSNNHYFSPMTGSGLKEEYKSIFAQQQLYRYMKKTEAVVNPYAGLNQGTLSFTFDRGVVLLLGINYSVGISIDFNGNYALHYSYAIPSVNETARVGIASAGYSANLMYTNRYLVSDLKEYSESIGGSWGSGLSVGADIIYMDGTQPDGFQISVGEGVGGDLNIVKSYTEIIFESKKKNIGNDISDYLKKLRSDKQ